MHESFNKRVTSKPALGNRTRVLQAADHGPVVPVVRVMVGGCGCMPSWGGQPSWAGVLASAGVQVVAMGSHSKAAARCAMSEITWAHEAVP
jgi:hypothetical protein